MEAEDADVEIDADLEDEGSDVEETVDAPAATGTQGKSKGKGRTQVKQGKGIERCKDDCSESDSDVGISKGEAWKLRQTKGKGEGKKKEGESSDPLHQDWLSLAIRPDSEADVEETEGADSKNETSKKGRPRGTIARWVETGGFGFIRQDAGGEDLFFHRSSLKVSPQAVAVRFLDLHGKDRLEVRYSATLFENKARASSVKITDARWVSALAAEWESPSWLTTGIGERPTGGKRKERSGEDSDVGLQKQKGSRQEEQSVGQKDEPTSVAEWRASQDRLFGDLRQLPGNWIRIRSKSSGNLYYYDTKTGASQFDEPL